MERIGCRFALVLSYLALLVCPVAAANQSVDSGNKHSIDRYNSLQLRAEQQTYQQSAEPLSSVDRRKLEMQSQQQRLQQRNLQLRQDQRLQAERHRHRINQVDPYGLYRSGPSSQSQQQQQRLKMRMQRNTWSYPRN
jgi:exonuclease VII large subunit